MAAIQYLTFNPVVITHSLTPNPEEPEKNCHKGTMAQRTTFGKIYLCVLVSGGEKVLP
jgi:hypothetical protein